MHKCIMCGKTDEGSTFVGFHGWVGRIKGHPVAGELCDTCAESHGCICGCYPSPVKRLFAEIMGVGLERNEEGVWQYSEED